MGLEDIFNITGLPVDGSPIVCGDFEPRKLLMDMFRDDDPDGYKNTYYVMKSWFSIRFEKVRDEDVHEEENRNRWLIRYA